MRSEGAHVIHLLLQAVLTPDGVREAMQTYDLDRDEVLDALDELAEECGEDPVLTEDDLP